MDTIQSADDLGKTNNICRKVKALAGLSEGYISKQPIKTHAGNTIVSTEDIAEVCMTSAVIK